MVEEIREIDINKLDPNPFQPRVEWLEEELRGLGKSMKAQGQIEPTVSRPHPSIPGRYQTCVGERRVRACKLVGIPKIQAIVRNLSDEVMALYVLVENLQRQNLNPIEQARGFKNLQARGWTQERIAKEVGQGLTRDKVAQALRLLTFPDELQELVSRDTITATHAESLTRLADEPSLLKDAISKVVEQKLTTRETEQIVDEITNRHGRRRQIEEYLTSEEFILQLKHFFDAVSVTDAGWCPLCGGKVTYEDSDGRQRRLRDAGGSMHTIAALYSTS